MLRERVVSTVDTFLYIIQFSLFICALVVLQIVAWPLSSENRKELRRSWNEHGD